MAGVRAILSLHEVAMMAGVMTHVEVGFANPLMEVLLQHVTAYKLCPVMFTQAMPLFPPRPETTRYRGHCDH